LGKSFLDAIGSESVKDSKFDFTDAFFYDKRGTIEKRRCDVFSRLQSTVVWRGIDDVELVAAGEETARA
jgi:hypothetical protein